MVYKKHFFKCTNKGWIQSWIFLPYGPYFLGLFQILIEFGIVRTQTLTNAF